jgi:autotransporter-associated beta strand protein
LSGWTDVEVKYRVSSTSSYLGGGNTHSDRIAAYIATTTYGNQRKADFAKVDPSLVLTGWDYGAIWSYDSKTSRQTVSSTSWAGKRTLALEIYATNDYATKFWNIDNVSLEGTRTNSLDCWWDGDGSGAVSGGSGIWDTNTTKCWTTSSAGDIHKAWNSGNGDNAFFAQTGGTVTIPSATTVAVRSLTFTADGYTIAKGDSASRLALTNGGSGGPGANTIEIADAGHTATIYSTIMANPGVGLTKIGNGTLVLAGANSYSGETAIRAGTVVVSMSANLGASGAKVALDGGTLRFAANVNLFDNHPWTIRSNSVIDTQSYLCETMTAGWSGQGSLTKIGSGVLYLDGWNPDFQGAIIIKQGTLRLGSFESLLNCSAIDVSSDAIFDVSAVAGGYRLGNAGSQKLQGTGTILGDLRIDALGAHNLGNSPGIQRVLGNYSMNGLLEIEINGSKPAANGMGYDQVLLSDGSFDVLLGGRLSLVWSDTGWSNVGDKLWIINNETDGAFSGAFQGYANGDLVGNYDGLSWRIYYGANVADGQLSGGNDVLLLATTEVPEPGSLCLLLAAAVIGWVSRRGFRG